MQQVLKMKIDGLPRKKEDTLKSAVRRPLLEKREKWCTPVISGNVKNKPASYFALIEAHPPNA